MPRAPGAPPIGLGDVHQCRLERTAHEERHGKSWQLLRCAECDRREWHEEG